MITHVITAHVQYIKRLLRKLCLRVTFLGIKVRVGDVAQWRDGASKPRSMKSLVFAPKCVSQL